MVDQVSGINKAPRPARERKLMVSLDDGTELSLEDYKAYLYKPHAGDVSKQARRRQKPRDAMGKEDGARSYVDFLEKVAENSLPSEKLTPEDRRRLKMAHKRLREQFDELAKWFIDPIRDTNLPSADYGYGRLWELMSSAFMIGATGIVSDSARPLIMAQTAKHANRAKSAEAAERNLKLDDAIKAVAKEKNEALATGTKFADRIRPEVLAQLGLQDDQKIGKWPSSSTIKNAIARIKSVSS